MRAILIAVLLLSACSHTQVSVNNSRSTTTANAQVQASNGWAAAVLAGMLVSVAASDVGSTTKPVMDPDRTILEQDCTQPIELTGNLRCR